MRAFQLACEQGADGIEFDVLLSADAIPIVIHDDTLDRTTNGTGPVKSMTAAHCNCSTPVTARQPYT